MDNYAAQNEAGDKKISLAIMSSFGILTIQYFILLCFQLIGTSTGQLIQLLSKSIVGFFYLIALPTVLRRNKVKFTIIYLIAIILFLYNSLVYSQNWGYLKLIIFPLFFTCLPSFIYAYSIDDQEILMDIIEKVSIMVFVVGFILSMLVFIGKFSVGAYSMTLSYYMLLPSIIYLNKFMDNFSLKYGTVLIILFFIIFSLGSRGPVLCIGIFTIIKVLDSFDRMNYVRFLSYIIIFLIVIIGLLYYDDILLYAYNLLLSIGINSRTLRLFSSKNLNIRSRVEIYKTVFENVMLSPILGIGMAGDRLVLGGMYTHNIFLELLASHGFIVGIIIIIALLFILIKAFFIKDDTKHNIFIIWISIGFIPLLVSGSYLLDLNFWILMGLASKALKTGRCRNNYLFNNKYHTVSIRK